jgi:cytochrome c oxidase subunit 4
MSQHVESLAVYVGVFVLLLFLLAVTVAASFINLGVLGNLTLALVIAVSKALIIAAFFMHLRRSDTLVWVFAAAGFIWVAILLIHMASDYLARGWVPLG